MRAVRLLLTSLAIIAAFFFGTLRAISYYESVRRDEVRAEHGRVLKDALERYRVANGAYPNLPDSPVDGLKPALVDGGYLALIPQDPLWPDKPYRYHSPGDTPRYGLLFSLEHGKAPVCLTGEHAVGTGWWGEPPACPF